jgi:hypothetical protein
MGWRRLHTRSAVFNATFWRGGCAVKGKRFSIEQITAELQQVEGGVPVGDGVPADRDRRAGRRGGLARSI